MHRDHHRRHGLILQKGNRQHDSREGAAKAVRLAWSHVLFPVKTENTAAGAAFDLDHLSISSKDRTAIPASDGGRPPWAKARWRAPERLDGHERLIGPALELAQAVFGFPDHFFDSRHCRFVMYEITKSPIAL